MSFYVMRPDPTAACLNHGPGMAHCATSAALHAAGPLRRLYGMGPPSQPWLPMGAVGAKPPPNAEVACASCTAHTDGSPQPPTPLHTSTPAWYTSTVRRAVGYTPAQPCIRRSVISETLLHTWYHGTRWPPLELQAAPKPVFAPPPPPLTLA